MKVYNLLRIPNSDDVLWNPEKELKGGFHFG